MRNFTQPIFAFLFSVGLFLIGGNGEVRGQWELLLGEEEENWRYQDMEVGEGGGLLIIVEVDDSFQLLRTNIFGQLVWAYDFEELNLPDVEIVNPTAQILPNSEYLLFYATDSLQTNKRLAKLNPNGKLLWANDLAFYGEVIEMESGNYLQIVSAEMEDTSEEDERDVITTAISRENGSVLWKEVYTTEADEQIWKRKWTDDGAYMIAGKSNRHNIFVMNFSAEGEYIGGYMYDFEGEIGEYYLSDLEITQDNGLITTRSYEYEGMSYYYPFITLEKIDEFGNSVWSRTYDDTDEDFAFAFYEIAHNRIIEASNGNYLLYHNHSYEWDIFPIIIEFSPTGEILLQEYLQLSYDEWDNGICPFGFALDKVEPLSDGDYLLSGYSPHTINAPNVCFTIPTAVRLGSNGSIRWIDFYDLGIGNEMDFSHIKSIDSFHQDCFLVSEVSTLGGSNGSVYIVNVGENGLVYGNHLNGKTYLDLNENCEQEVVDKNLSNSLITIKSPEFTRYAFTDASGNFSAELPVGDYSISHTIDNQLLKPSCNANSYQISFTENYDTTSNINFPLQALIECSKLEVEIGTPLLRRCFTNTYKIQYCNKGTLAAENAKISLEFPEEMIPLTSSISALEEGQQWTFDLGTVGIGECGFFMVTDSISCEADLGSTICLKSRILPDDACEEPHPLWDGSEVTVSGECLGEQVVFTLENVGNGAMNEERNFYVFANDVLQESRKIQLGSGERQQIYMNPNGRTLRLEVEQSVYFQTSNDEGQSIVAVCGAGNFSFGYVNSTELFDRHPSVDIDCQEVIGSFDPNDIQVFPSGVGAEHLIEETTRLTYKIRFQNTGSDTAFRVMIVDTLPQELEGASLNLGSSSHDYSFDIKFGNLLVWTFEDILLPDSTTNERDSHGFVQFSISPKKNLEVGTKVYNQADIYFDFNAPVATNRVFNTITDDLVVDLGEPLFVELVDIDVKVLEGNLIQLDWWTLAEANSSHFEVERSVDGIHFEVIGVVNAQGQSKGLWHYQLLDSDIGGETLLYYRLKWVNTDGTYDYSATISLRFQRQLAEYQLIDNSGQQLLLDWRGELEEEFTVRVFNLLGQNILNYKVNDLQTVLPFLESNVYVMQVVDGKGKSMVSEKIFVR